MSKSISYQKDVIAWSNEQAALLRSGRFNELDIENIAEEIEDVGKSEQRELASRFAVLIAHLMKWQYQPERQGKSWKNTINNQRKAIQRRLEKTPSLKNNLKDPEWLEDVWGDALILFDKETQDNLLNTRPCSPVWTISKIQDRKFFPEIS